MFLFFTSRTFHFSNMYKEVCSWLKVNTMGNTSVSTDIWHRKERQREARAQREKWWAISEQIRWMKIIIIILNSIASPIWSINKIENTHFWSNSTFISLFLIQIPPPHYYISSTPFCAPPSPQRLSVAVLQGQHEHSWPVSADLRLQRRTFAPRRLLYEQCAR